MAVVVCPRFGERGCVWRLGERAHAHAGHGNRAVALLDESAQAVSIHGPLAERQAPRSSSTSHIRSVKKSADRDCLPPQSERRGEIYNQEL